MKKVITIAILTASLQVMGQYDTTANGWKSSFTVQPLSYTLGEEYQVYALAFENTPNLIGDFSKEWLAIHYIYISAPQSIAEEFKDDMLTAGYGEYSWNMAMRFGEWMFINHMDSYNEWVEEYLDQF